jgi:hypothetical protein
MDIIDANKMVVTTLLPFVLQTQQYLPVNKLLVLLFHTVTVHPSTILAPAAARAARDCLHQMRPALYCQAE